MIGDLDQFWAPAAALLAMIALSAFTANRLPASARLPMQWGPGGKATWTAPVWIAISFTPALTIFVYAVTILATAASPLQAKILTIQGLVFLAFHAAHLFFATRRGAAER